MRRTKENLPERIYDALSGYAVLVLGILVFTLAMAAVIAFVRLLGAA